MICTLIGHRDAPSTTEEKLKNVLEQMITEKGVTRFLIGNNGNFDFFNGRTHGCDSTK